MSTDATTFDAISVDAPVVEDHSARNRLVIALLLVSAFVVILNETIMGVAVPHTNKFGKPYPDAAYKQP